MELLVLPGWRTPATPLDAWVSELETHGGLVVVTDELPGAVSLEIAPIRLRGYAMLAGRNVEAINFELPDADPSAGTRAIGAAAEALGWEVHFDDDDDDDDDDHTAA